jgi:type IV secretory pathway VirB2 component (pilin)
MQPANCQRARHLDCRKAFAQVAGAAWRSLAQIVWALFLAIAAHAQQGGNSPWENAVTVLKTAFTGTIATGLSLVAIVVGGLMFAYGEGQSKRMLAGIVFGVGMAIGAVNFMAWLFPG